MPLRMSDIAKSLGVSRTTVSRVLSGQAEKFRIAPETAARIVKEAGRSGYRPSQLARGLRTSSSRTLGLIVSDISNPFFANIAFAAEQVAEQNGFVTVLGSSGENIQREQDYIENLRSRGADGLIVAACGPDFEHFQRLREEGFPFVLIDRVFNEVDCDWVAAENINSARALVDALIAQGARRIAHLGGRLQTSTGLGRLEGYRAALRTRRIPFEPDLFVRGDFSVDSGRRGVEQLLKLKNPPDAVFCANNKVLTGCLERLAEEPGAKWARMPMACFDEVPLMSLLGRPLWVAAQPVRRIGSRAAELLIQRVRSGAPGTPRMKKPYTHELFDVEQKRYGL